MVHPQGKHVPGRRAEDELGNAFDEAVTDDDSEDQGEYPDSPRRGSLTGSRAEPAAILGSSSGTKRRSQRHEEHPSLSIMTGIVALVVASIAMISAGLLQAHTLNDNVAPVLQSVVSTSYQALALGLLGWLAKQVVEQRMARRAAASALRDRRYSSIDGLVSASHLVDNARLLIRANRSVKTLTEQMSAAVIPARSRVRLVAHDLRNWEEAGSPTFHDSTRIIGLADRMSSYLMTLIDEYADNKSGLSEHQRRAERSDEGDRLVLLDELWESLQERGVIGDWLQDGAAYAQHREDYVQALDLMRGELAYAS